LLDKDGTIIDIHHYWGSMLKERAQLIVNRWFFDSDSQAKIFNELIDAMGIEIESGRMKPEGPVGVKPRPFIVKVASEVVCMNGVTTEEEEIEKLFKEVDLQTANDILPLLKVLPGVYTFIVACHDMGVQLGVVTTDITERGRKALQALKMNPYFQYIIGGDKVNNPKPASDSVDIILAQSGIKKSRVAVIGDHSVDIMMGINSGVVTNIGVLTGLGNWDTFNELGCYITSSFNNVKIRS
jgi:phosphoglycolate phosphatase-like HAD superfamily hydrolase